MIENHETIGAPEIVRTLVPMRDDFFTRAQTTTGTEARLIVTAQAYGIGSVLQAYRRGLRLRDDNHEYALLYALDFINHDRLYAEEDEVIHLKGYISGLEMVEVIVKDAYKEFL